MSDVEDLSEEELTRSLTYSGFILVAFELVKSMIVRPIKAFYHNVTFSEGGPFKSYKEDVAVRHGSEFEACLMYLRDFMEALDSEDFLTIQELRKHRNFLSHNLPNIIAKLEVNDYLPLLIKTDKVLFKLSNYQVRREIGADPDFQGIDVDWSIVTGSEYILFKEILGKVKVIRGAA